MLTIRLALVGVTLTDSSDRAEFMQSFGPENAHRIALTRDADGALQIIFSAESGPKRDGATELVQATLLVDSGDKKSYLLTTQIPTETLGEITPAEQAQIGQFLESYFSDGKKDVVLLAKSDKELQGKTSILLVTVKGETVFMKDVSKAIGDYVRTDKAMFLYQEGKLAKIDAAKLDENLSGDLDLDSDYPAFHGAEQVIPVGLETTLARGQQVEIASGAIIQTIAFVKDEGGKMVMTLLDQQTLAEVDSHDFDGDYAMSDHGGKIVYVMKALAGADIAADEIFQVTAHPAADFGKKQAEDSPQA